jgi:RimJ/RimL family protein N-acetyltransferase
MESVEAVRGKEERKMSSSVSEENKMPLPYIFEENGYRFVSYTELADADHAEIIEKRNVYRNLAHNTALLTMEGHLEFVGKLKNMTDRMYFSVRNAENIQIFSINIQNIDRKLKSCEWGFFKIKKCDSRDVLRSFVRYLFEKSFIETITGCVKVDNVKSHLIHADLGFEAEQELNRDGEKVYILKKRRFKEVDNAQT